MRKVLKVVGISAVAFVVATFGIAAVLSVLGFEAEPTAAVELPTTTSTSVSTTTTTLVTTTSTTTPPVTTTVPPATTVSSLDFTLEEMEVLLVAFLRAWSADQPYWTVVDASSDEDIVYLAYTACEALDLGATANDLFVMIVETGAELGLGDQDNADMAYVLGASVEAICPEHSDKLEQ